MITPITRYEFLIYHKDVHSFLDNLRELGIVDINIKEFINTATQQKIIESINKYKTVCNYLKTIDIDANKTINDVRLDKVVFDNVEDAVEQSLDAIENLQTMKNQREQAHKEFLELEKWGHFNPETLNKLKEQNIILRLFKCSHKAFKQEWHNEYVIDIIREDKTYIYFVVIQKEVDDKGKAEINVSATELPMPEISSKEKQQEIDDYNEQEQYNKEILAKALSAYDDINAQLNSSIEQLDFDKALHSGENYAEGRLRIIEGWSETSDKEKIEEFATTQDIIFVSEKAQKNDNPPVKLKNSWFNSLFEPIGNLYILPRYDEIDLTPFFAPFFMIFFGICLGDAGYGALFIVVIAIFWKKIPTKFKPLGWLMVFFSISTIIFGILTGNILGIPLVELESFKEFKKYMVLSDPNTIFYFSIGIGVLQVLFGQVLRIFNRIKRYGSFIYGVSSIGWVTFFVSSIVAYALEQTDALWYDIVLLFAGVLIIFFANPSKNIFASVGSGLYNVYETATGIIGDLISYVRLFAVGLAGAIIAQVFNELAIGLSGDIIIVKQLVMVFILLFGHGLNIFISVLSAFVHPIRLTFVEFYKNAEFEGGGRVFKPFKKH